MIKLPDWYNKVQSTDKKYTKDVSYGKVHFTSINAQYQNRLATEHLGMYGSGWGISAAYFETTTDVSGKPMILSIEATFFYHIAEKLIEFPIASEMEYYDSKGNLNRDLRKKLLTDVTTKALSKIGFNADIFLGLYDDQKYVDSLQDVDPVFKKPITKGLINQMKTLIKNTGNKKDLYSVRKKLESFDVDEKTLTEINKLADDKEIVLRKGQ